MLPMRVESGCFCQSESSDPSCEAQKTIWKQGGSEEVKDKAKAGIVKLHDIVKRVPSIDFRVDKYFVRIKGPIDAEVVYIHPKGRYHVVRFDFPGGSFRESFTGVIE